MTNLVEFEPSNTDHLLAYYSLKYKGKQSAMRFKTHPGFQDVLSTMQFKISQAYLKQTLGELDFRY